MKNGGIVHSQTQKQEVPVRKILLVEDDENTSQLMCEILRSAYEVLCCKTPFYAISALAYFEADLIITDVALPSADRVDGIDVYEIIADGFSNLQIPMIVVSGIWDEKVRRRAMNAGAKAYIPKPFEPEDLLASVHSALSPKPSIKQI